MIILILHFFISKKKQIPHVIKATLINHIRLNAIYDFALISFCALRFPWRRPRTPSTLS